MDEKILGGISKSKYVCFLPFRGEFGWYIMTFVKRFHGYKHENKIVCIKKGHECLFPTASGFFYEWNDIHDNEKAGIVAANDEDVIKAMVVKEFGEDVFFVSPNEASWDEKTSLAEYTFVPENKTNNNLNVDIVIFPRMRNIDSHRNWKKENWQLFVNTVTANGFTVGICGAKETSYQLDNVLYNSYDYVDVDSDVEMIRNSKLVIAQESGLLYLSFMCKKPTIVIDHYNWLCMHRDLAVPFKVSSHFDAPDLLASDVLKFLKTGILE